MTAPALAFFVSPHGFGHAARACAVMEAIREKNPAVRFEIFTTVPKAFFRESLGGEGVGYHPMVTDVGLVQKTPFAADIPATVAEVGRFVASLAARAFRLAEKLERLGCAAAVCDISPLGISAARKAALPSVLVENFTWDWIYEGYADRHAEIGALGDTLGRMFEKADVRIQTEPVCRPVAASLTVGPVSRKIRSGRNRVRRFLGVPTARAMVLISLGGIAGRPDYVDALARHADLFFVIANAGTRRRPAANIVGLEAFSGAYHPDLVGAADVLVGKAGYSTVAEACRAGVPFAYLARNDFRESAVLTKYIHSRLEGVALDPDGFEAGGWLGRIEPLLSAPRRPIRSDGAERIAAELIGRFPVLTERAVRSHRAARPDRSFRQKRRSR